MKKTWIYAAGSFSLLGLMVACGGDSPTKPNDPPPAAATTPTPAPTATVTPTPAPVAGVPPAEQQAPNEEEHDGPVTSARVRLYAVRNRPGGDLRPGPYYDPVSDNDVVTQGEFLVIDTTAFNADGQKCVTDDPPQWTIEREGLFEILNSNNSFQIRANARRKGVTAVYTDIDGKRSNVIHIEVR
jgi:hypothetical protein